MLPEVAKLADHPANPMPSRSLTMISLVYNADLDARRSTKAISVMKESAEIAESNAAARAPRTLASPVSPRGLKQKAGANHLMVFRFALIHLVVFLLLASPARQGFRR